MNIVSIKEEDIPRAAEVLTTAFVNDPIFKFIFNDEAHYETAAPWLFSTWIRWSVMFGNAWMSDDGKAVIIMRSLEHSEMSLWSMIRAGMLPTPWKLGWRAFKRFYFEIVATLDKKHASIMGKQAHWYGWMVGATERGAGSGGPLINHCANIADEKGLPVFLETATPENLPLYAAKGFQVMDSTVISTECTIYFLVRQPRNAGLSNHQTLQKNESTIVHS
ncbi:MAG: hypothetical protein ABI378_07750 [Chitinophagaceae bacterium]